MAWLSASLFLLPVMKLRVVRGMVEGDGGVDDEGGSMAWDGGKEGRREGGLMISAASLACDCGALFRIPIILEQGRPLSLIIRNGRGFRVYLHILQAFVLLKYSQMRRAI